MLPSGYDPDSVCLTFDVEWAHADVIADTVALLDERGLKGTFFVTHANVHVGSHERGLHPNFRRNGDLYRCVADAGTISDVALYREIVKNAHAFAPEAKGVRTHSLFFDTSLLGVLRDRGLEYDSTLRLELAPHLCPVWKQAQILEIPTYYADYFDMDAAATGWRLKSLRLDAPGLKVFDFHPTLIFINAPNVPAYDAVRPFYHDVERLRSARFSGPGARTLFVELLDELVRKRATVTTMNAINGAWRATEPFW